MSEKCTDSNRHEWEIYEDRADEWRWRRKAPNGEIVGASSEGYNNKEDCKANARLNGMTCDPV